MTDKQIAILNLMPNKRETEDHFKAVLPPNVNITFVYPKTHNFKGTSIKYLRNNYKTLDEIKSQNMDGMIITGAPLEHMDFHQVDYWTELTEIMDYAKGLKSCLFICWAAIAALYHYYEVPRKVVEQKVFGVFNHSKSADSLFKNISGKFAIPHSRYFVFPEGDLTPDIEILAKSPESGISLLANKQRNLIFMAGHLEYNLDTLQREYLRDIQKGLETPIPRNYFTNDDPHLGMAANWNQNAKQFFHNWVDYYLG